MAVAPLPAVRPQPGRAAAPEERLVLVNASVGLSPERLEDRERYTARFDRSRWVAVGADILTLVGTQRRLRPHIELGTGARDVRTSMVFVGHDRLPLTRWGVGGEDRPQRAPRVAPAGAERACLTAVMLRPIGSLALLGLLGRGAVASMRPPPDFRVSGRTRAWQLRQGHRAIDMHPPPTVQVSDTEALAVAAPLGLRPTLRPDHVAQDELRRGHRVSAAPDLQPAPMPISAVVPLERLVPPRVWAVPDALETLRERRS